MLIADTQWKCVMTDKLSLQGFPSQFVVNIVIHRIQDVVQQLSNGLFASK